MTLRDYFAARCAGSLSRVVWQEDYSGQTLWPPTRVAERAYRIADAMLAERTKGTP
ncbi:MAG: hypothetical protein KGL39_57110 [Patescibacteria group bacterium]|nr:hypothetical protein [Patescibacteria group bacterium]